MEEDSIDTMFLSDEFSHLILEVKSGAEEPMEEFKSFLRKVEEYSRKMASDKCDHHSVKNWRSQLLSMCLIGSLIPVELQLTIGSNYTKILNYLLSLYLDFNLILSKRSKSRKSANREMVLFDTFNCIKTMLDGDLGEIWSVLSMSSQMMADPVSLEAFIRLLLSKSIGGRSQSGTPEGRLDTVTHVDREGRLDTVTHVDRERRLDTVTHVDPEGRLDTVNHTSEQYMRMMNVVRVFDFQSDSFQSRLATMIMSVKIPFEIKDYLKHHFPMFKFEEKGTKESFPMFKFEEKGTRENSSMFKFEEKGAKESSSMCKFEEKGTRESIKIKLFSNFDGFEKFLKALKTKIRKEDFEAIIDTSAERKPVSKGHTSVRDEESVELVKEILKECGEVKVLEVPIVELNGKLTAKKDTKSGLDKNGDVGESEPEEVDLKKAKNADEEAKKSDEEKNPSEKNDLESTKKVTSTTITHYEESDEEEDMDDVSKVSSSGEGSHDKKKPSQGEEEEKEKEIPVEKLLGKQTRKNTGKEWSGLSQDSRSRDSKIRCYSQKPKTKYQSDDEESGSNVSKESDEKVTSKLSLKGKSPKKTPKRGRQSNTRSDPLSEGREEESAVDSEENEEITPTKKSAAKKFDEIFPAKKNTFKRKAERSSDEEESDAKESEGKSGLKSDLKRSGSKKRKESIFNDDDSDGGGDVLQSDLKESSQKSDLKVSTPKKKALFDDWDSDDSTYGTKWKKNQFSGRTKFPFKKGQKSVLEDVEDSDGSKKSSTSKRSEASSCKKSVSQGSQSSKESGKNSNVSNVSNGSSKKSEGKKIHYFETDDDDDSDLEFPIKGRKVGRQLSCQKKKAAEEEKAKVSKSSSRESAKKGKGETLKKKKNKSYFLDSEVESYASEKSDLSFHSVRSGFNDDSKGGESDPDGDNQATQIYTQPVASSSNVSSSKSPSSKVSSSKSPKSKGASGSESTDSDDEDIEDNGQNFDWTQCDIASYIIQLPRIDEDKMMHRKPNGSWVHLLGEF